MPVFRAIVATNQVCHSGDVFSPEALESIARQLPGKKVVGWFEPEDVLGTVVNAYVVNGKVVTDVDGLPPLYEGEGLLYLVPKGKLVKTRSEGLLPPTQRIIDEVTIESLGPTRDPDDPNLTRIRKVG